MHDRDPIDGDFLGRSLSREIVTPGEVSAIVDTLQHEVDVAGEVSTVNGRPARVTPYYAKVKVHDPEGDPDDDPDIFYARAFQYIPDNEHDETPLPGIVLGDTPDTKVTTTNPNAIQFQKFGDIFVVVVDDDNDLVPEINDPVHVEKIKEIVRDLVAAGEGIRAQAERARLRKQEESARQRAERREKIKGRVVRGGLIGTGVTAVSGLIGLVAWGLSSIEIPDTLRDFDEQGLTLEGGAAVVVGDNNEVHPQYSVELYEDDDLESTDVPGLTADPEDRYDDIEDDRLDREDGVRQMIMYSSKRGQECESADLEQHLRLGTVIKVWTDFAFEADGTSRAREITVKATATRVIACWSDGEELGADDDPRILLKIENRDTVGQH